MYSAELEKHKKEKEEWRRKAEMLGDKSAALQVTSGNYSSISELYRSVMRWR